MYRNKSGVEMLITCQDAPSHACRRLGTGTSVSSGALGDCSMVCALWPWGAARWLLLIWLGSKSVCWSSLLPHETFLPFPQPYYVRFGNVSSRGAVVQLRPWSSISRGRIKSARAEAVPALEDNDASAAWKAALMLDASQDLHSKMDEFLLQ